MTSGNFSYEYSGSGYDFNPWGREFPSYLGVPVGEKETCDSTYDGRGGDLRVEVVGTALRVTFRERWGQRVGFVWKHQGSYHSRMEKGGRPGVLGKGWLLADMPFMVAQINEGSKRMQLGVVDGMGDVVWFEADSLGGWTALPGREGLLEHSTVDRSYRFTNDGEVYLTFHNFECGMPRQLRGRVKGIHSRAARRAKVDYSSHDEIQRVAWLDREGRELALQYEYDMDAAIFPRLKGVQFSIDGELKQKVQHTYFRNLDSQGLLETTTLEVLNGEKWELMARVAYRYEKNLLLSGVDVQQSEDAAPMSGNIFFSRYKMGYDSDGGIKWIRHEGGGSPPLFLD